ncbi:hypothetical protein ACFYPT_39070 [Streptomyces sp. NPDC005529]|uniref:hypothetical protein n=1 Tax=unclassified Streptomyces TaxID=2593676 RepID=UPI0033BF37AA
MTGEAKPVPTSLEFGTDSYVIYDGMFVYCRYSSQSYHVYASGEYLMAWDDSSQSSYYLKLDNGEYIRNQPGQVWLKVIDTVWHLVQENGEDAVFEDAGDGSAGGNAEWAGGGVDNSGPAEGTPDWEEASQTPDSSPQEQGVTQEKIDAVVAEFTEIYDVFDRLPDNEAAEGTNLKDLISAMSLHEGAFEFENSQEAGTIEYTVVSGGDRVDNFSVDSSHTSG